MKTCLECGVVMEGMSHMKVRKYCSNKCADQRNKRHLGRMKVFSLPPGTVGAMSELLIAVDLFKKGYEVYRPLSPSCSGDLIIQKNEKTIKVEIRTGFVQEKTKKLNYSIKFVRSEILAVYAHQDDSIHYLNFPSLTKAEL